MAEFQSSSERWLPVPGYEGAYEVSNEGRVLSLPRVFVRRDGTKYPVRGQMLNPAVNGRGYLIVALRAGVNSRNFLVHRVVMLAFVGPLPAGMLTRHLNGDPADNRLSNLKYGTDAQNSHDSVKHGTNSFHNLHAPKTHCIHGHEFIEMNMNPRNLPHRKCKACARARARVQRNPALEFKAESDRQYALILAGDPHLRKAA